jgi:hypothetical protein
MQGPPLVPALAATCLSLITFLQELAVTKIRSLPAGCLTGDPKGACEPMPAETFPMTFG